MAHMNPEWTRWAKNSIRLLKDGGYLVYPLGVAFQVDKTNGKLVTICEVPGYHDSHVDRTNRAVFDSIGYTVERTEPVPSNLEETIRWIEANSTTSLISADTIVGFSKLFKVEPTVVEEMLRKSMGNKEPINPLTIRGFNPEGAGPRALAMGRLWLTSTSVTEGQHKFDPGNKSGDLDKTMQFIIFEEITKLDVLSHLVADENDFVKGVKELRLPGQRHFILTGNPTRGDAEKRDLTFTKVLRDNSWWIVVKSFKSDHNSEPLSSVMFTYQQFDKGLGHLFVKGELIVPEHN